MNSAGTITSGNADAKAARTPDGSTASSPAQYRDQFLGITAGIVADDRGLAHSGYFKHPALDLRRLDAKTADLHLVVEAPEILDGPICCPASKIASAIDASAGSERVPDEFACCQLGVAQIPPGEAVAADADFTDGTDIEHRAGLVQDGDLRVADRPAERDVAKIVAGNAVANRKCRRTPSAHSH